MNSGRALHSHRGESNSHHKSGNPKLQVSVIDGMGPTPPGTHHRMLSEGMSLITPGILTDRSSSNFRGGHQQSYNAEQFNRLSKYVIHSN